MGFCAMVARLSFGDCSVGRNGNVHIRLAGDEASDIINFVLKDDATNTWWDHLGSNFAGALRV